MTRFAERVGVQCSGIFILVSGFEMRIYERDAERTLFQIRRLRTNFRESYLPTSSDRLHIAWRRDTTTDKKIEDALG